MGPRLGSRGKNTKSTVGKWQENASMGPRLGSRGKATQPARTFVDRSASMGPRLGSRGKHKASSRIKSSGLLQWGRDLEVAERKGKKKSRGKSRGASMGPRLGSRGKFARLAANDYANLASMGPRLGSRGKSFVLLGKVEPSKLQWGRDLEVAESRFSLSFSCTAILLQWGRDLEVAERVPRPVTTNCISCFNGAATWKSRKVVLRVSCNRDMFALQWGRDLEVAESESIAMPSARRIIASMGPRLGSRGKYHTAQCQLGF